MTIDELKKQIKGCENLLVKYKKELVKKENEIKG